MGLMILATSIYRIKNEASGRPRGHVTYRQVFIASYTVYLFLCMLVVAVIFFALNKYVEVAVFD
jgi:hypothetical protein